MTFRKLLEVFRDMGKLSDDELTKGKKLDKNKDDNFNSVPARNFYNIISKIKVNDLARGDSAKGLESLTVYTINEYKHMKCYLGKNNSSGYAIHKTELVSVFSSQKSSGDAIVQDAIKNGARHLDCFAKRNKSGKISGSLYTLYSRNGFKIDKGMSSGKPGEAYTIIKGVSDFVGDDGKVQPQNENVVIFMKKG